MLLRIENIFAANSSRKEFFAIVGRHFPIFSEEYVLIEKAYDTAKNAFRLHLRDDGATRYFEHLRGVALILMEYLRIRDANVIAAALLHDIIEDIEGWNEERLALRFNKGVAQLVWWVTKPSVDLYSGDKEARNRAYHQNLGCAPRWAIIIKLADRLHNLLTLWAVPEEKQRRKVRETQDFYLQLAEKEIVIVHEIEAVIVRIQGSFPPVAKVE